MKAVSHNVAVLVRYALHCLRAQQRATDTQVDYMQHVADYSVLKLGRTAIHNAFDWSLTSVHIGAAWGLT